jgi:hypothetical protein
MASHDDIAKRFFERQHSEGLTLAAASDRLELAALGAQPAQVYLARFRCTGLVRIDRQIVEHDDFVVGIRLPDSYLRRFDTAQVLTWCEPLSIWHPNIRPPYVCVGRMEPGTPLVDLLYQLYEIITYHNVEMREPHALNHDACVWARHNVDRFPVDRRPLRRALPPPEPAVRPSGHAVCRPEH